MKIVHTNGSNKDFYKICEALDVSLNANAPGRKEAGLNSLYDIENIKDVFLLYKDGIVIGSAGLWQHCAEVCELIRVFVLDEHRGNGYVGLLAEKVEELAKSKGYNKIKLRTWSSTPYAVRAYEKLGYSEVTASKAGIKDKFARALALSGFRVFMEKEIK